MASAETEHFRIGLRQQNGLQQSGPAGARPALAPEGAADSHSWAQAHQQVKPIWKLEKKHSGTLSAGPGPGLPGVSPQPAYFLCPRTLCRSGSAAVIGAAGGGASGGGAGGGGLSNSSLQPLPDLFGSSLLYRRASSRLRPYQQLESFCLRSVPSEKRPFAFPHSSLPYGLTAQKAHSASASTMALPLAPSSPEPYLSLPGAAGENASTKSLAPAVAGKAPLPITPPPAYKPVLNNNAFLRPNSTKVPLLPAPEALKPLVPKIQLVSWHHSGGTGDCAIRPLEQKLPGGDDSLPKNLLAPSTPRSQSSPDLGGALAPLAPAREVQLTEAVRKLTVTDVDQGGGGELEQPRFLMPGLLCSALGMSPPWQAPSEGPQPPSPSREATRAPADRTSDTPVFCTKRISVHLLAARAATAAATSRLSPSLSCGTGPSPPIPPLEEAHTRVLSSPPQLLPDISAVTSRLSSAHLGQWGSAEPVEGRELDLPAGSAANQVTQVETEDVEEELVDGLEDFCSHDEDEEEEGDSDCSSSSTASQGESLVVISRSCTEILTKSFPSDKVVQPALVYSLFPNVPPTIYFGTRDERVEKLPWEQRKLLRWKMSTVTPNIVKQTVGRSHFKLSKRNDDWLGCWGHHMKSPGFRSIREYQKLNHFPGSFQIGRKDRLWRNLSRMQSRFGRKEFSFFPQSFILPQDAKLLRKAWESNSRQKWIVKPPASARGIGIQVIHKWNQLPKRRPLLVQRYLHKPYLISGSKFDLRIYVYVTCYDPLRIYLFSDGLVRFASCKYSPSMKSLGNKFMHLTNYSVNKKNAEYQTNEDETACQGHKWALKALWNYLSQKGVNSDAIWEKIKDVVVKTIISSEPYVTSLLKMYVRRPYSCHELFGFDIMLDENLKPWVLEVNISPSLHSNSPLDVSIKGQMIRDLLNLAGFVLPSTEELLSSSSSGSSSSGLSLPGSRDKCRMSPEQFTAQRLKKAYYLNQKIPDQDFYASVLDVLTPDDVRVLVELEDEFSRRGQFERIFPSRVSSRYLRFFEQPRYFNILTSQWEQKYHGNKLKGVDLLRSWCYKGFHTGAISDSAPVWSLPPSILTSPKADMMYSLFSRSEASRLGKHSSSGGVLPPAEGGASPKPRRTEAGLFHLPRRRSPSPARGSQDSSREPGPVLPDIRFSRQAVHCAGPPATQPSGDRLLATASP